MKRVLVRSVRGAFEYVIGHYYCFGKEDAGGETDSYAVISIQDSHMGGFGFAFQENQFCKGVLTLYFDDIVTETADAVLFTDEMAEQILDFIAAHKDAETLLVHCYAGESRSRAVGAFAVDLLGGDNSAYFADGRMNTYIYDVLENAWVMRQLRRLDGE